MMADFKNKIGKVFDFKNKQCSKKSFILLSLIGLLLGVVVIYFIFSLKDYSKSPTNNFVKENEDECSCQTSIDDSSESDKTKCFIQFPTSDSFKEEKNKCYTYGFLLPNNEMEPVISINIPMEGYNTSYTPKDSVSITSDRKGEEIVLSKIDSETKAKEEVLRLDKSHSLKIYETDSNNDYPDVLFSLSPDEKKIAVSSSRGLFVYDLNKKVEKYYIVNDGDEKVSGSSYEYIAPIWKDAINNKRLRVEDLHSYTLGSPVWSADSLYLSVRLTHFKEATDYFVTSYLIIDAINHKLYNPITSNPFTALKWSPTGHSYIFTQPAYFLRDSNETTAFHYCDGNDMNKTLDLGEILGIDSINYSYANISPDGKKIMVVYSEYVMPTIMEIEKYTIAILNTDGTGLKVIPDKEIIYGVKPIFSADSKYIYYFTKHQGKDLFVKYDLAHKKYSNFMLFNTDLEWYDLSLTKDGYLEAHSMVSGTNDTPTKYITLILDIEKQELVSVLAESK